MLKVAQYAAQLEDYDKAINIYESVAASCLDSSLLKYSAKEYFFRASLCHMSVDLLNAQHALDKYAQQYPAFQDSREFKLVKVSKIAFFCVFVCLMSEQCTLELFVRLLICKLSVDHENCIFCLFRHSSNIWKSKILMVTQKQ